MDFKTTDLFDEHEEEVRVCDPLFRDFGGKKQFGGPVRIIKCFEDNSLVRATLEEPGEGRVLIVDAGGSLRCAMLGDMIAAIGVKNGWAGVVMYGCIRDSVDIAGMDIGVKAIATNPRKSTKRGEGQRDLPVSFGSVTFRPGDYVYCDEDGILASSKPLG